MENHKQVEICNVDQWRGPSARHGESDHFLSLLVPFIEELDRAGREELKITAEHCKSDWKQWEMRYVYQNIGDMYQKMICDIGGFLNPLLRLFAMKSGICHMYDLILPDGALISQLAYNSLIKYERQDVCSLVCPDDTFDVVCSISTLEHVANKYSALSEMIRVTKPGGLVICTCDALSHDLDYQLEDPFFSDIPLNEGAIENLLGIAIHLPNKDQCWDLWKKDSVYMSLPDRWSDWKFPFQREYTALGFVLRVKSNTGGKAETDYSLGPVATFDSAHSACNHLVWGFYNVEPHGGRFTRKVARLKLKYDSEQHKYFYLRGYYPSLSRTTNLLRIALGGTTVVNIPLMEWDQILDLCVAVPTNLVSGTVFVDLEVENSVTAAGADERVLGVLVNECGFTPSYCCDDGKRT
jgi:SAM-dependent methyltransferase